MKVHRAKLHDRLAPGLPKHPTTYDWYNYTDSDFLDDLDFLDDCQYYDDSYWDNEYILVTLSEDKLEFHLTDNDTKYQEIHESYLVDYPHKCSKEAQQIFEELYPEYLI